MGNATKIIPLLACAVLARIACANDATFGLVYKSVYYTQTSAAAPALGTNPFDANEVRARYSAALRAADHSEYQLLLAFVRN